MPTAAQTAKANQAQAFEYVFEELKDLQDKITAAADLPEDLHDRLEKMLHRLNTMAKLGTYTSDFDIIARYIETVTAIPWKVRTKDKLDLVGTADLLNSTHYGMQTVKDRILEYLATMIMITKKGENAVSKSPVILLVGLQGVGKTTVAQSIALALERKFVRIALGAIGSATELRGSGKSQPEAEPGQIIKALIKTGVRNPVILLDEIEKTSGERGLLADIQATLLEILDPAQSIAFRDHYIDYPYDLSDVFFIF